MKRDIRHHKQSGFAVGYVMFGVALAVLLSMGGLNGLMNILETSLGFNAQQVTLARLGQVKTIIETTISDQDTVLDGIAEVVPAENFVNLENDVTGGGTVPTSLTSAIYDGYGTAFKYCTWEHGAEVFTADAFRGETTNNIAATDTLFALLSAGPDKTFQTTCLQAKASNWQGDDMGVSVAMAESSIASLDLPVCTDQQVLTWGSSGWECVSRAVTDDLVEEVITCMESGQVYNQNTETCEIPAGVAAVLPTESVANEGTETAEYYHAIDMKNNYLVKLAYDRVETSIRAFDGSWTKGPTFFLDDGYEGYKDVRIVQGEDMTYPQIFVSTRVDPAVYNDYKIYIFDWQGPFNASELAAGNVISGTIRGYGTAIAVSEDGLYMAVGAPQGDGLISQDDHVYVYYRGDHYESFTDNAIADLTIDATDIPGGGAAKYPIGFGAALDFNGNDWLVISYATYGAPINFEGRLYAASYERTGANAWTLRESLELNGTGADHTAWTTGPKLIATENDRLFAFNNTTRSDEIQYYQLVGANWILQDTYTLPYVRDWSAPYNTYYSSYPASTQSLILDQNWLAVRQDYAGPVAAIDANGFTAAHGLLTLYEYDALDDRWEPTHVYADHFNEVKSVTAAQKRYVWPNYIALDYTNRAVAMRLNEQIDAGTFNSEIVVFSPTEAGGDNIIFGTGAETCPDKTHNAYIGTTLAPGADVPFTTQSAGNCFADWDNDTQSWN